MSSSSESNDSDVSRELTRRRKVVETRFASSLDELSADRKSGKKRQAIVWSTESLDHAEAARKMSRIETDMPGPSGAGQKFALVNKTHVGRRPASGAAGFRILGIFSDTGEAAAWINEVPGVLDRTGVSLLGDIYAVPLRRWTLLASTMEREEKEELARGSPGSSSKIGRMLEAHLKRRESISAEFKARLSSTSASPSASPSAAPTAGSPSGSQDGDSGGERSGERSTSTQKANAVSWRGSDQVPEQGRLREHSYAAIVVLQDYEEIRDDECETTEPALMILGAFGSEEDALEYIKTTAALWIVDHDIHVVDSYVWHWPEKVSASSSPSSALAVKRTYRDDELSLIMESARKSSEITKLAEDSARSAGKDISVIEIGGSESEAQLVPGQGETSVWPEVDRQLRARNGCTGDISTDISTDM